MKHRALALVVLLTLVATSGCVKLKSDYDAVANQLATCQADLATKTNDMSAKQTNLDACQAQWQEALKAFGGQQAKTENVIQGLREWKTQVEKSLPTQVRGEVEARLDILVRQIEAGFGALAKENQRLTEAMEKQTKEIAGVGTSVNSAREDLIKQIDTMQAAKKVTSAGIADAVKRINDWEQARLNCKDCDSKLKLHLNKKEREAVTELHSGLTTLLTSLQ